MTESRSEDLPAEDLQNHDRDGQPEDRPEPPMTGEPTVDRALESLQGLESAPLADHHDRLGRVHEELHAALNADHPASGS